MVDLPLFKDLPHVKVVADNVQAFHNMMTWIMQETRRRLAVLQGASCRKIQDYHAMYSGDISMMPYIIVMIDEFGDLMDLDSAIRKGGDSLDEVPTVKQWIKSASQIWRTSYLLYPTRKR
jgi:DNA segregation ATPase FtsK/SpoIIIE-like protein